MTEAQLEVVRKYLPQLRLPDQYTRVFKDECVYSFDTPESPQGLFVNLSTFTAVGWDYLDLDFQKTGNGIYLRQKWTRVPIKEDEQKDNKKPTILAIGVEGGFNPDQKKFEYEKANSLYVMPDRFEIPLPSDSLPMLVSQVVEAVLSHDDAAKADQIEQYQEKPEVSKYAENLVQLDNGIKISPNPKDWKCQESGMTENLWLNLSTGHIGSGRRNWDGTGGTGAALRHFEETGGRFPLVVKLGTITPFGADVYSYAPDEDRMVIDPKLGEHLSHWGINITSMSKTEKTMDELDLELNLTWESKALTESGAEVVPLHGAGLVGLKNLGNSCYCNSLYQVLFSTAQFRSRYLEQAQQIFAQQIGNPAQDLTAQLAKLATGLLTDRYVDQEEGLAPRMLKSLLGQGHSEFGTNRQQDVFEYFQHLLTQIERAEKARGGAGGAGGSDVSRQFRFQLETRLEDEQSGQVRYVRQADNVLSLSLPLDRAQNPAEFAAYEQALRLWEAQPPASRGERPAVVRARLNFEDVLGQWAAEEEVGSFLSPVTKALGTARRRVRFASFPPLLAVHVRRYVLNPDWTPRKLDALVPFPDSLDLSGLRGGGLQEGETAMPEEPKAAAQKFEPSPAIIEGILGMGMTDYAAIRAAKAVNNAGVEEAVNWVLEHMGDPDINDPLPDENAQAGGAEPEVDYSEGLAMLASMGIDEGLALRGLKATGGDMERAVDWCFSHADDPMEVEDAPPAGGAAAEEEDGSGKYELFGIISHMGSSTLSGHYVCHLRLGDGRWVLFNDEKVQLSQQPPKDMGYLYFYRRV